MLSLWTVYRHPKDAPGLYVARRWLLDVATAETVQATTLEGVRELIPPGLHCMPRAPGDDPVIVETWF